MTWPTLPVLPQGDCWNRIGVWGDRSCGELTEAVHCHNCAVFAAAGRHFLEAPPPAGYLEEWSARLAAPIEEAAIDLQSVLIFRLGEEWLALRVQVLTEVTGPQVVHRIPHRSGLLAGLVNIRGELQLCCHLTQLLGLGGPPTEAAAPGRAAVLARPAPDRRRLLVAENEGDRWVFPVDEVEQVYRCSAGELTATPGTLARSATRLTRAVFTWRERSVGLLDDVRLFQALRARVQ